MDIRNDKPDVHQFHSGVSSRAAPISWLKIDRDKLQSPSTTRDSQQEKRSLIQIMGHCPGNCNWWIVGRSHWIRWTSDQVNSTKPKPGIIKMENWSEIDEEEEEEAERTLERAFINICDPQGEEKRSREFNYKLTQPPTTTSPIDLSVWVPINYRHPSPE